MQKTQICQASTAVCQANPLALASHECWLQPLTLRFALGSLFICLEKQQRMALGPCIHVEDLEEAPGF